MDTRVVTAERVGWIIPRDIDNLIVDVWNQRETSPFSSLKRAKRDAPPKNWKKILSDHVEQMSKAKAETTQSEKS